MKEYKIKYSSFIGGWFIPQKICENILQFFKENKQHAFKGLIGNSNNKKYDKKVKDSLDLTIKHTNFNYPFGEYRMYLQKCLEQYLIKYPEANDSDKFNVYPGYNIQYYQPNGGFKKWHHESSSKDTSTRHLVFMTYLNNAKNSGTEFKYQKLKTECIQGLTLIWPPSFTHTHRGVINKKYEKYIVTGWFSFI